MAKVNTASSGVKAKIPGLYESEGAISTDFPAFDKGDYFVECDSFEEKVTKAGDKVNHSAKLLIVDGPEQIDGRDIVAKPLFANYVLNDPEHEFYTLGVNKLKNFLNAAGIPVSRDGSFDHKKAVGKKFWVTLSKKPVKDENGKVVKDKYRNEIVACFQDREDGGGV